MRSATTAPVCGIVLLREDGAALLQLRDDKPDLQDAGLWVFPGGHVESGERPEEGAWREFMEETRYRCGPLHRLVSFPSESIGYEPGYEVVFFWTPFDGRQPFTCCEGQEVRFVAREEVEGLPRRGYLSHVWDLALTASGIRPEGELNGT